MVAAMIRRSPTVRSLLSLGLCWLFASPVRGETIRLSALQPDEVIVARVQSWGCFHFHAKYEVRFQLDPGSPHRASVTVKRLTGLWHRNLGTRFVEAPELRALDAGVDAYRKHDAVCVSTTLNEVRLRLVRDGEVVAEEMHRGDSCDVSAIPGASDLSQLPAEFDSRRPKGQTDAYVRPNNRMNPSAGDGLAPD